MSKSVLFLLVLCGGSAASAQEPTFEQLLATPTAAEIVEQWKTICFDHPGDSKAQTEAIKTSGLTWPYQAMVDMRGQKPACLVVSSTKIGTSINDFAGPLSAVTSRPAEKFKADGRGLSADIELEGKAYWVGVSSKGTRGNLVSTVVLAVK